MTELEVKDLTKPTRLDNFLLTQFPEMTRSTVKKLVLNWLVKRDDYKIRPSTLVKNGDKIKIDLNGIRAFIEKHDLAQLKPVKMDLKIVYEDEYTLLIDKPSGIVTHPVYQHYEDTLMNGVTYYILHEAENPFTKVRPVNRLDKDTSGLILLSKNLEAHTYYSKLFKKREVTKTYLAIVDGDFESLLVKRKQEAITVKSYISKRTSGFVYSSSNQFDGDYAETDIYFDKYLEGNKSLLKVIPKTGRTHQIRVHLSELGFPIVGDKSYGGSEFERLLLHSWRLKLVLFEQSEPTQFESVLPEFFM